MTWWRTTIPIFDHQFIEKVGVSEERQIIELFFNPN